MAGGDGLALLWLARAELSALSGRNGHGTHEHGAGLCLHGGEIGAGCPSIPERPDVGLISLGPVKSAGFPRVGRLGASSLKAYICHAVSRGGQKTARDAPNVALCREKRRLFRYSRPGHGQRSNGERSGHSTAVSYRGLLLARRLDWSCDREKRSFSSPQMMRGPTAL